MLAMLIQSLLKSLSGMSCIAVILADASALSGLFMGYEIVKSTQLEDPIMTAVFSSLLLSSTFIDIFNQAFGLIFALCCEMKWILRLYMALTLTVLFIRCSILFKPPVVGLKSAPLLGRPWSSSNTPYDQMNQDIINFYSQSQRQARNTSLSTFETKLHCCGVNAPEDYSAKYGQPASCGGSPAKLPTLGGSSSGAASNTSSGGAASNSSSGRLAEPASSGTTGTPVSAGGSTTTPPVSGADGSVTSSPADTNSSSSGGGGGGGGDSTLVAAGLHALRTGCKPRVWAIWEGSKVVFDATVSAITFTILTVVLTVAWCELWGEGLLTGIQCCQEKPAKKVVMKPAK